MKNISKTVHMNHQKSVHMHHGRIAYYEMMESNGGHPQPKNCFLPPQKTQRKNLFPCALGVLCDLHDYPESSLPCFLLRKFWSKALIWLTHVTH